jgi:S-DNA-T family DNA segregation ATPase FtsK/SpoIIIE
MREEREEVRKVDAEQRAKREPVKIEPPAAPVVEKANGQARNPDPDVPGRQRRWLGPAAAGAAGRSQAAAPGYDEETLETLSRQIEFKQGLPHRCARWSAYPGPVITRFEIEPAPGVKVSQISSLDKDIARGLSVKSVRVVDVIPGKSVIGLEIPNVTREMIYLSEMLRSKEYDKSASALTLALGKDIGGRRPWPTWPRCRTCWWPAPPARASRWRSTRWC